MSNFYVVKLNSVCNLIAGETKVTTNVPSRLLFLESFEDANVEREDSTIEMGGNKGDFLMKKVEFLIHILIRM